MPAAHPHGAARRAPTANDADADRERCSRASANSCTPRRRTSTPIDAARASANVGGSQAHLNMQPFLTLNFCIALEGIFPSPN